MYLKKPFSDIQYAAPSTSTAAFLPINPQFVPTCWNEKVKGAPTNLMIKRDVSVQILVASLPLIAPTILVPSASLCVPAVFVAVGVQDVNDS